MASKYDRYKEEFIRELCLGKVETFSEFAKKKKWIKHNLAEQSTIAQLGKTWSEEGLGRLKKITQAAEGRLVDELEITITEALKAKRAIFAVMMLRLKRRKDKLSANELKQLWEVAKTEAGQPSRITATRVGEDKENPFTTLADALNATAASHPESTIVEEPPA